MTKQAKDGNQAKSTKRKEHSFYNFLMAYYTSMEV